MGLSNEKNLISYGNRYLDLGAWKQLYIHVQVSNGDELIIFYGGFEKYANHI